MILKGRNSIPDRLLVILKEPNDPDGKWGASGGDIREFGRSGGRPATWNNLVRWSALVDNPDLTLAEIDVADSEVRQRHLRRIAVMNLKKRPGRATSVMKDIRSYAEQHWILLQEQLQLYRPYVTIAGGVFPILRDLMDRTERREEGSCYSYFEDETLGVCFDFYHPQQRHYKNEVLFDDLKRLIIERLGGQKYELARNIKAL